MAGAFEDDRGGEGARRQIAEEGELTSRGDQPRRCSGGHRAPLQPYSLRFAEKPAGIHVASKTTGRYPTKIINATCVGAVIKTGRSGPTRIRITARRRRTITRSLILLDGCTGQRAGRGSCGCANRRGSDVTSRRAADDRAGGCAPCCALAERSIT